MFATFGLHLFDTVYDNRCRTTENPITAINGTVTWPILEGYHVLCYMGVP